jgi:hypothetical protein
MGCSTGFFWFESTRVVVCVLHRECGIPSGIQSQRLASFAAADTASLFLLSVHLLQVEKTLFGLVTGP